MEIIFSKMVYPYMRTVKEQRKEKMS